MNETVARLLEQGRERKRQEEAKRVEALALQSCADDAHWIALEEAIRADLKAHGIEEAFVTLGDRPEDFSAGTLDGIMPRWHATKRHTLRLSIPGVGEIARQYQFFNYREEPAEFWRPSGYDRGHGRIEDNSWGAVVSEVHRGDDAATVGPAGMENWQWFAELSDALAAAELQYHRTNGLLLEAQGINEHKAEIRERRQAQKRPLTTAEKLVDILDDFIRERIPEAVEN